MNQEHIPEHTSTFGKGAAYDIDQEALGAQPNSGLYVDGRNVRPTSNQGNTEAAEKIRGEQILYTNTTTLTGAICAYSDSINQHLTEVWVDPTTTPHTCLIRVDGVIVMQTQFQFPTGEPVFNYLSVQGDKNESGTLTELFLTDNTVAPYIFDITDMINNVGQPKYFSNFNPILYQINLQSPLDRPVFIELKDVGVGLPVGQYRYQMQYSNDEGDVTNWSMASDLIPVVENLSQQSSVYPYAKTYGGPPAPTSPTGYSIHIRFRVTNIYNYRYINIKRLSYNEGAGLNFTPNGVVVAKIPIAPGEISVRDYYDPNQSNTDIALSETQETQVIAEVKRAKSIRYFDRRTILMNVEVPSKLTAPTFLTINGKTGFPVIEKLGTAGHKDPYNHATKRSFMRGEVEGFGVVEFDGVGTQGFVTKATGLENYQFPNRRDPISTETAQYSLYGTVRAATTSVTAVDQTHEVFDIAGGVAKGDYYSFKNIMRSGPFVSLTGTKSKSTVNSTVPVSETNSGIESHGAYVDSHNNVSVSYQPYHPVSQNDPSITGHNFVCTTGVFEDTSGQQANNPNGFAPNYYAMGMCLPGVSNFASWAKAFAVVKTPSQRKVICQGIGYYSMIQADFDFISNTKLCTKDQNRMWFYSPDIQNGIVSSDQVNDIIANPQNYALQFVSPLGFFSEIRGFETSNNDLRPNRDGIIDMISYVRMIRDISTGIYSNGDPGLNPGETINMGINGGDGYRYVTWAKFRNQTFPSPPLPFQSNGGNQLYNMSDCERLVEGRGEYLSIGTIGDFYAQTNTGGTGGNDFNDTGMQNWTEPIYTVNIVRVGTVVIDQNIEGYQQTTHYQKLESIIGLSNGLPLQRFPLVDERWEDCIPAPNSTLNGANIDRFIYVRDPNTGITTKWINVTYKTGPQIATIIAAMPTNGISGLYIHENVNNLNRFYNIVFSNPNFVPAAGNYILVRYDDTAPIRVFGGDTYISEAIFSPIDRVANSVDAQADTQFQFGIGFPYHKVELNARYYEIKKTTASLNVIQDAIDCRLGFIRQMTAMFTCEHRCGLHYSYNQQNPNQSFPLMDYVIRPAQWDVAKNMNDNGIWPQYAIDYPNEIDFWEWGGFRFLPQVNPDYACEAPIAFFSQPEFGFVENTVYDTRIMWSLPRVIGVQDSPSLKTFPANNSFDIDDNQGEIKRAWDATTGSKGENLYAFTNKGICLLVTRKSILSNVDASQVGLMATNSFVQDQYWISKDIGMFDEWWRSAAEAYVPLTQQDGTEIRRQAIFFGNNESFFRFMENQCVDIARESNYFVPLTAAIKQVLPSYQTFMTGIFDKFYQEYWVSFMGLQAPISFAYSQKTGKWLGKRDYLFDKYIVRQNQTYGLRGLETFTLDTGYIINGAPIEFELLIACAPEQTQGKEFERVKINSPKGQKPTSVEFYYDKTLTLACLTDPSLGTLYLKDYNNYEQNIGRTLASFNSARPRLQGRSILYKIFHTLASEFKVIDASIKYKKLK